MRRRPTDGAELYVAGDLLDVTRRLRRVVRRHLRELLPDLPPPQMEVLQAITDSPRVGVGDVAGTLCLAPNTVSTLIKELVAGGLVHRTPREDDRRGCQLTVTAEGQDLVATWRDRRSEIVATAIAQLAPADQQALATCVPILRDLINAVDKA